MTSRPTPVDSSSSPVQADHSEWWTTRHGFSKEDAAHVRRFGEVVVPQLPRYVSRFYAWMRNEPEYAQFFSQSERVERVQHLQVEHWRHFFQAHVDDAYLARRRRLGEVHARIGLSLPSYFAGIEQSVTILIELFREEALSEGERCRCIESFHRLMWLDAALVVDAYSRLSSQTIADQTRALIEMSTPVTALWDDILMLPVVGLVDSRRAQEIMSSSLDRIAAQRARVFIMDISGVAVVDTAVANHLIKIVRAARLLGCRSILSGLSPAVAETLVELGVDVSAAHTVATLRDALAEAFRLVGFHVRREMDAR